MDTVTTILLCLVISAYFAAYYYIVFYRLFYSNSKMQRRVKQFYISLCSVYTNAVSAVAIPNTNYENILDQVALNFNQITKDLNLKNKMTLSDMLEEIIYYHDSYTETRFAKVLGSSKNSDVRNFAYILREKVMSKEPYSSLPPKEAALLKTLKEAINTNNASLATISLDQLSSEILSKENVIQKQSRDNLNTTLISVVGLILTVVFGVLSIM